MKTVIQTKNAPAAIGPYSQAVVSDGFLFSSGQIPIDPQTGELCSGDVTDQARRVMQNLAAVLEAYGLDFSDVVKTTVFLTDMNDFAAVNGVYGEFFTEPYPARSCVGVAALPRGAKLEAELIARIRDRV